MNDNELLKLWETIEMIICSPTKKDAKYLVNKLNIEINGYKSKIVDPYLFNKLKSVISYAEEASGRVPNKEHWKSCAEQDWYTFENGIKHSR